MLGAEQLTQPAAVVTAYAATVRAQVAILAALNAEITRMQEQVEAHFGRHPDAEIYRSQPGMGQILAARVLAEFGDDPTRYAGARSRKNYAASSPIARQSGKKKLVLARYVHNDRLVDALQRQAYRALTRISGRPRLLRPAPRPRRRPPRRPAPARQPLGRHPPRLPQDGHHLRRGNRLAAPRTQGRSLTTKRHATCAYS